jgi:uncharacterized membrane protein
MSGSQGGANQGPPPSGTWRYQRAHLEFDRVAFFTDAVFAIAMTLLIVTVQVPPLEGPIDAPGTLLGAMTGLWPQLFSFFLAFLLLGRYWMSHHAFFSGLKSIDRRLVAWNLVYLAFVAFLPFPTNLVGEYENNPLSVVLFALTLAAISGLEAVILRLAHKGGNLARPMPEDVYRYGMAQSLTPVILFLVSIPISFWNPTVALLSWLLSIPLGIILARRRPKEAVELLEHMDPGGQDAD